MSIEKFGNAAAMHHGLIYAMLHESYNICRRLDSSRDYSFEAALDQLGQMDSIPKFYREVSIAVSKQRKIVIEAERKLDSNVRAELLDVWNVVSKNRNIDDIEKACKLLLSEKRPLKGLELGLELGLHWIETGRKNVYNLNYMNLHFGLKELVPPSSHSGGSSSGGSAMASTGYSPQGLVGSDVLGAVIGAVAGALTTGFVHVAFPPSAGAAPISLPTVTVAAGVGSGIGASLKYAWDWGMANYHGPQMGGGPCNHCPGSPEGPIGPQPSMPDDLPPPP